MAHYFQRLLTAATFLGLVSCQKEAAGPASTTLEGAWRLTRRQCYCPSAPEPDETITFTATRFAFYRGNRALRFGDYTFITAAVPCFNNGTTGPALHLTYSTSANSLGSDSVQYRLDGNTLTLDYGGPCDAPVDTYERLP